MTNQEYITMVFEQTFDTQLSVEELIKIPRYCEFENDMYNFIVEDFAKIGCDTSSGGPTEIGMQIWMNAKVNQKMKALFDRKYRNLQ